MTDTLPLWCRICEHRGVETRGPDNRRVLTVGERHKIMPGAAHCISNESVYECQFLLVQGVGKYDWHKADLVNRADGGNRN
jgi:hypothetical protein